MNTKSGTRCRRTVRLLMIAAGAATLSACVTPKNGDVGAMLDDGDVTNQCSSGYGNNTPPGQSGGDNKWRTVCIVVNDDDCPVKTVYDGNVYFSDSRNGPGFDLSGVSTNKKKRVYWQAVTEDTSTDPATYRIRELQDLTILFAPFKKQKFTTGRKGHTRSDKLECLVDSDNCLPEKVAFKYTVWLNSEACKDKPLDPVIWINE
jgi:hypothetical protein